MKKFYLVETIVVERRIYVVQSEGPPNGRAQDLISSKKMCPPLEYQKSDERISGVDDITKGQLSKRFAKAGSEAYDPSGYYITEIS
jgi:hypothetical protein